MPKNQKYHLAVSGTFDVENYGDLMFPIILEKALRARGLDFELTLLSPLGAVARPLSSDKVKIYPADDFQKLNKEHPFDALIVGGGAILHFQKITAKSPSDKDFQDYGIVDSWFTPILTAMENNLKIIFNAPQVPFVIPAELSKLARAVLDEVSYISVRDELSKNYIEDIYQGEKSPKITVCPDSICSIAKYIPKAELKEAKEELLGHINKYAVVHFNRTIPEDAASALAGTVRKLKQSGLEVVLLPLGYTHGDDVAMVEFRKKYEAECIILDKKLSLKDMTAILAYCELYIGTSFHGSVVSIAYGNKAISYNYYEPNAKNLELYHQYGVEPYLAKHFTEVDHILDKALTNDFKPDLKGVNALVEKHFDTIYKEILEKPSRKSTQLNEKITDGIMSAIDGIVIGEKQKQELESKLNAEEIAKAELQKRYHELEQSYNDMLNSRSWRATAPLRKISEKVHKTN